MNLSTNSGILDNFKSELNPIIWENSVMKNSFKEKILQQVDAFCGEYALELKGVLIYGGNAGYQYGDLSDVDISVYIDWDKADTSRYEEYAEALRDRKIILPNKLEIHFMLKIPSERELVEANENVYNILDGVWIQEPVKYSFNPIDQFAKEIDKANLFKRLLEREYNKVQEEIKEYKEAGVEQLPLESLENLQKLVQIVKQVRVNRDIEHQKIRKKAIAGEKITLFDRATQNEIVWKMIADLPMTRTLKELSYKN